MDDKHKLEGKHYSKRIGLLGGTFDPVHMTHLHMAEVAKKECNLDQVWFVPAKTPPHKKRDSVSPSTDRLKMVEDAIEDIPYFQLSMVEFEREGPSYTVDTIIGLKHDYPQYQFYFIIGADMVDDLPNWHRIEELIKVVGFIGVGRPDWKLNETQPFYEHVTIVDMIPSHLSSTLIRERKKEGKSIRFLIPEKVYAYIEEQHLYEST